jgi:hypothetical protein
MSRTHFELYIGSSTDGCSIHPHYEEGTHLSLEDAKAHAASVTGRRLSWEWVAERKRWRVGQNGGSIGAGRVP